MFSAANLNLATLRVTCSNCALREQCLPAGLDQDLVDVLEEAIVSRRRLRRGEALYQAGDRFEGLFAIRVGYLKSVTLTGNGQEQVTGFHMAGDVLGLDGLANQVYASDAIALEDAELCVLPRRRLEDLIASHQSFGQHFLRLLSTALVRHTGMLVMLGSMRAEERIAAFLLHLSQRLESRGYSRSEFVLRMTRAEIGSCLGLQLETVSRVLSHLSQDGLIAVNQKHLRILDFEGLREVVVGQWAGAAAHGDGPRR